MSLPSGYRRAVERREAAENNPAVLQEVKRLVRRLTAAGRVIRWSGKERMSFDLKSWHSFLEGLSGIV
jgi:hypothetical protein